MKRCVSRSLIIAAALLAVIGIGCGGGGSTAVTSQLPPPTPAPQFAITTTSLAPALVGNPYSVQLTSTNGTGSISWTTSQLLPPGMTFTNAGVLSGTPTGPIDIPLSITATDSSSPAKSVTTSLKFNCAGMYVGLTKGQIGTYYNNEIQFSEATEPISWTLLSGSIPPGLEMQPASAGNFQLMFRGFPTQAGVFTVTVRAIDAINRTAQQTASINIIPPALKISDTLMQLGVVNQTFHHLLTATGGTPPYTFSVSGSFPSGLQLNASTGEISGIPKTAGFSQFNITVKDTTSPNVFTFSKPYNLLVTPSALPSRNESIADATPIFPGTYNASLSPYTDSSRNAAPDQDYYVMEGNGGEVYQIGVSSNYDLWPAVGDPEPVTASTDPSLEILDGTGTRLATCNDPLADNPPPGAPFSKGTGTFTDACIDHGGNGTAGTSTISVKLPPGTNEPFYIHVFDFKGRARPDFEYSLSVSKQ